MAMTKPYLFIKYTNPIINIGVSNYSEKNPLKILPRPFLKHDISKFGEKKGRSVGRDFYF